METFASRLEQTIVQLSAYTNQIDKEIPIAQQSAIDCMIQNVLADIVSFMNETLLSSLSQDILEDTIQQSLTFEVFSVQRTTHIQYRDRDQKVLQIVGVLLRCFDLLLKTLQLFFNFEKKQEEYQRFYDLRAEDYIGRFLRKWDQFYIDWIMGFQKKESSRQNLVQLSRVFYFCHTNQVLLASGRKQHVNPSIQSAMDHQKAMNAPLNGSTAPIDLPSNLIRMYKVFLKKLESYNDKLFDNYEDESTEFFQKSALVLDTSVFPKIRYHKSSTKAPSLFMVAYQKCLYNNNSLGFELSFEERRASDQLRSKHPTSDIVLPNRIVEILTSKNSQFHATLMSLDPDCMLNEEWSRRNVTLLYERRADPEVFINSVNITSDDLIDSDMSDDNCMIIDSTTCMGNDDFSSSGIALK